MGVFAGTERQCTEDEHDSQTSEFGLRERELIDTPSEERESTPEEERRIA
jgi:hypothetical protein